jgi:hypothetical protein
VHEKDGDDGPLDFPAPPVFENYRPCEAYFSDHKPVYCHFKVLFPVRVKAKEGTFARLCMARLRDLRLLAVPRIVARHDGVDVLNEKEFKAPCSEEFVIEIENTSYVWARWSMSVIEKASSITFTPENGVLITGAKTMVKLKLGKPSSGFLTVVVHCEDTPEESHPSFKLLIAKGKK